jgi:hypothetical protein
MSRSFPLCARNGGRTGWSTASLLFGTAAVISPTVLFTDSAKAEKPDKPIFYSLSCLGSGGGSDPLEFSIEWNYLNSDNSYIYYDDDDYDSWPLSPDEDIIMYIYICENATTGPWSLYSWSYAYYGTFSGSSDYDNDVYDTGTSYDFYLQAVDQSESGDGDYISDPSDVWAVNVPA